MGFCKRSLVALPIAAFIGLTGVGHVSAAPTPFIVTPSAVGEPGAPFVATFIDFSYVALVDQIAAAGTGTFSESGVGFFGTFRHPGLADIIPAPTSGLNFNYKLYFTFDATGTVSPGGGGGLNVSFTTFTANLYVDNNLDTTCVFQPGATACGTAPTGVGAPNESVGVAGNAEDDLVGVGTLLFGEAHVFPSLAAGDFDVLLLFEPVGGFFSGPVFVGLTVADISGVNSLLTGFSAGSFIDGRIDGSGNLFFEAAVPEPSALLMLGSGLLGLAAIIRRRSKR